MKYLRKEKISRVIVFKNSLYLTGNKSIYEPIILVNSKAKKPKR